MTVNNHWTGLDYCQHRSLKLLFSTKRSVQWYWLWTVIPGSCTKLAEYKWTCSVRTCCNTNSLKFQCYVSCLETSGKARMNKLCGHSMGTLSVCVTHILLGDLGHTPPWNYTLWHHRFRPQVPFFRLTCMLASCLYKIDDRTIDCTWLVSSSHLSPYETHEDFYQGPSKFTRAWPV